MATLVAPLSAEIDDGATYSLAPCPELPRLYETNCPGCGQQMYFREPVVVTSTMYCGCRW